MSRRGIETRQLLGTISAILLGVSGTASAQSAPPPWNLNGSDTLELVVKDAISAAQVAPNGLGGVLLTPGLVNYVGGGSGTAESALTSNVQAIGPMSRNFSQTVLTAHPTWAPNVQGCVALDAAVIVTKNVATRAKNLVAPNAPNVAEQTNKAIPNVTSAYTPGVPGSGYSQLIELIVSGIDGSGSTAACSDPRRVQAVADFAAANNVPTLDTFYRRDDNSGTTNIFQDKMAVGRFCNGRARGILGTNTVNPNLNNQDLDPIRRPCTLATGQLATNCTNVATGVSCTPASNPAGCAGTNTCPCTHGLVVALSVGDPPQVDVTTTIADRVAADLNGQTFGYAGREAARQPGAPTNAPFMNSTTYNDGVVRLDQYLLSRRLYVNFAPDNTSLGTGGGGAPRIVAESALFNFMTDPAGTLNADGSVGRCNMDNIVKAHGFIPPTSSCTTPATGNNLCAKTPFPAALSTLANCLPNGTGGAGTFWDYGPITAAAAGTCCSDNSAVVAAGTCPSAKTGRASLAACSIASATSSECVSGVCTDVLGTGVLQCQ
jgi:ABC-type phosphate transport system substrate-binding protein